jgi:hypothetical protein
MSCPVAAPGPPVIDARPAYVGYREDAAFIKDAALIGKLFDSYTCGISTDPVSSINPETSPALAGFSGVERQIRQLLKSEEADEFGPVRPTDDSIEVARKTLFQLVQAGFAVPPLRDAGTDHDGALRLEWQNGPRFLELVVPRENHAAAYLYYSQGDQYNLQRDLAFEAVYERFNWLAS